MMTEDQLKEGCYYTATFSIKKFTEHGYIGVDRDIKDGELVIVQAVRFKIDRQMHLEWKNHGKRYDWCLYLKMLDNVRECCIDNFSNLID